MRDKVLCKGWAESETAKGEEESLSYEKGYSSFLNLFAFLIPISVPVSVKGGVEMRMSMEEFLSFFDHNMAWRDQKTQRRFLGRVSREKLDTIFATESLFKGTVLDFDLSSHSGGGSYASSNSTIN